MKTEEVKTLSDLVEFINEREEWNLAVNDIILANGWNDETGSEFGVCSSDKEVVFINERGEADLKSVPTIYKVCAGNAVNDTIYTNSFNNEKEARDYFDYLKKGLLSGKNPVNTDLGFKDNELFHIELISFPENDVDNIESLDITDEYLRSDI